jgi:hypothetical protein
MMCEHEECEHSLGPSSHCDECDRQDRLVREDKDRWLTADKIRDYQKQMQAAAIIDPKQLTAATIRKCHEQLKAVEITDPKELSEYFREAMRRRAKKRGL